MMRPVLSRFLPRVIPVFAAVFLLASPAVLAAPTCVDRAGDTIRCGTPGAMPVGWSLPAQEKRDRDIARSLDASPNEWLKVFCVLGLFFALLALLPEFDGSRAGDWDEQQGDDDE